MKGKIHKITGSHTSSRHMVGLIVIQHAYKLAYATQKHELLMKLYSTKLRLF
jgi:hypothetical protein